jgi:hypothetical protein
LPWAWRATRGTSSYQGDVWTDSCVEFFFTPGPDLDDGYFNIEANCGGTLEFTE